MTAQADELTVLNASLAVQRSHADSALGTHLRRHHPEDILDGLRIARRGQNLSQSADVQ